VNVRRVLVAPFCSHLHSYYGSSMVPSRAVSPSLGLSSNWTDLGARRGLVRPEYQALVRMIMVAMQQSIRRLREPIAAARGEPETRSSPLVLALRAKDAGPTVQKDSERLAEEKSITGRGDSLGTPVGLSEAALVRLETALHAQRERLFAGSVQPSTVREVGADISGPSAGGSKKVQVCAKPQVSAEAATEAVGPSSNPQRLPRAAQLAPLPGFVPAYTHLRPRGAPELSRSPLASGHRRRWRFRGLLKVAIAVAVYFLMLRAGS